MTVTVKSKLYVEPVNMFRNIFTLNMYSHFSPFLKYDMGCSFLKTFSSGIILGMDSANERQRYDVTSSLIGWAHVHDRQGPNYPPESIPWLLMTRNPSHRASPAMVITKLSHNKFQVQNPKKLEELTPCVRYNLWQIIFMSQWVCWLFTM